MRPFTYCIVYNHLKFCVAAPLGPQSNWICLMMTIQNVFIVCWPHSLKWDACVEWIDGYMCIPHTHGAHSSELELSDNDVINFIRPHILFTLHKYILWAILKRAISENLSEHFKKLLHFYYNWPQILWFILQGFLHSVCTVPQQSDGNVCTQ